MGREPEQSMETIVRPAAQDDAVAIAALLGELGYPTEVERVAARIERALQTNADAVLVVTRREAVCACASMHLLPLFHRDGFLARITSFVVTRSEQRRGVGSALHAACEAFAREHGAERLEVTSGDRRVDAHAFYEHAGYEREGVRMVCWLVGPGRR